MESSVPVRRSGWVGVLLAVRFLSELALLAGVGWLGALLGDGGWRSVLLVVLGVAAIGALWSLLMAPRSPRRLRDPARLLVEFVLFIGTGVSLAQQDHPKVALIPMGIAVVAAVLARIFAPED